MSREQTAEERKLIYETKTVLASGNTKNVLAKLNELKSTGNTLVFPFILDLLSNDDEDILIVSEVLRMISDLKDQNCAPILVGYIANTKFGSYLAEILAACWQSQLDYSPYLDIFINCFISGNYEEAIESFTVIEEMLWKSSEQEIDSFKSILIEQKAEVSADKEPLYCELLEVLENGESSNRDDYPDIYDR